MGSGADRAGGVADSVRLDKWLWATRFFKTRSLAQQAIRGGHVEINGHRAKPSRLVRIDDRLRITRAELVFEVDVTGLIERRVSAAMAAENYRETEAGRQARELRVEQLRADRADSPGRLRRPDKRQRRELKKLQRDQ
ncbi:MAG: RNA-binding S4 domain-containing protein [Wenzhouxiangella sp.]|nr:MAG: RNA-binding S4 domain-containing protein [Wenzhouxiangella sp.]